MSKISKKQLKEWLLQVAEDFESGKKKLMMCDWFDNWEDKCNTPCCIGGDLELVSKGRMTIHRDETKGNMPDISEDSFDDESALFDTSEWHLFISNATEKLIKEAIKSESVLWKNKDIDEIQDQDKKNEIGAAVTYDYINEYLKDV